MSLGVWKDNQNLVLNISMAQNIARDLEKELMAEKQKRNMQTPVIGEETLTIHVVQAEEEGTSQVPAGGNPQVPVIIIQMSSEQLRALVAEAVRDALPVNKPSPPERAQSARSAGRTNKGKRATREQSESDSSDDTIRYEDRKKGRWGAVSPGRLEEAAF